MTRSFRIVVTGGRDYADREHVFAVLDRLNPTHVAHGGAGKCDHDGRVICGADLLAAEWCKSRGVSCTEYKITNAEWREQGRAAGPIRNRRMLESEMPNATLEFPGGTGTADCTRQSRRRDITVLRSSEVQL